MGEHTCVACGYVRMSYYLNLRDICIWCDHFIPEHIPSEQAKKYLIAIVLKNHDHKLVYERKNVGSMLRKRYQDRLSNEDIKWMDKISGVSEGMSSSFVTTSQSWSSNVVLTQTYMSTQYSGSVQGP